MAPHVVLYCPRAPTLQLRRESSNFDAQQSQMAGARFIPQGAQPTSRVQIGPFVSRDAVPLQLQLSSDFAKLENKALCAYRNGGSLTSCWITGSELEPRHCQPRARNLRED